MQTITKSYRYKLYPTTAQAERFLQFSGCRRYVWNWALGQMQAHYEATGKSLSAFDIVKRLTELRHQPETTFLADAPVAMLRSPIADLHRAVQSFWAKRANHPKFKSKKTDPHRFRFSDAVVEVRDGYIHIPKIGAVNARGTGPTGKAQTAEFHLEPDGSWYCSVQMRVEVEELPPSDDALGIDAGLSSLVVTSDNQVVQPPKFMKAAARKLARAQKTLCRRMKGSARRRKAKQRVALIHRDVKRKREGFLHDLTTALVRRVGLIVVEDLCLKGLARTKLAKSFADAALGEMLRQLEYKCEWYGRRFVKIDRFYPSTKLCSNCGYNQALTLADRIWKCKLCGQVHDRDLNAAQNILAEGLRMVKAASERGEAINARGGAVRPGQCRRVPMKREVS